MTSKIEFQLAKNRDNSEQDLQSYQKYTQLKKDFNQAKVSKGDITELKSLKSPPRLVVKVLSVVCKLAGVNKNLQPANDGDEWSTVKKCLGDANGFLTALESLDCEKISAAVLDAVKDEVADKEFNYECTVAKGKSAGQMCALAVAAYEYARFCQQFQGSESK